jgi:HlyD family secretion protein
MALSLRKPGPVMIESTSSMDRPVAVSVLTRKRLIIGGAAAVVVILVAAIAYPSIRLWMRADRSIDASTLGIATVTRGDLRRDVSVQARVVAALHPTLVSQAAGIVSLRAKAGQVVRSGEVLAVVDSPELRSSLDQARALSLALDADAGRQKIVSRQSDTRLHEQVSLAQTRLEAARRELVRAETLHKEGLYSSGDYERAQDAVHVAELEVEQAAREVPLTKETNDFDVRTRVLQAQRQAALTNELEKRYGDLTIRAPFDGMIAAFAVNDRDSVIANQPVVSIVNLSSLELELNVPEEYANETRIGTPVSINFGAEERSGHVTSVSPEVVNNQLTARAVPDGGWPAGMKQNQRATVRLVFESRRGVVKAPRGAWLDSGGGRVAYVVDGTSATRREIVAGTVGASEVEIVSGLREGERIVVSDLTPFANGNTVILH